MTLRALKFFSFFLVPVWLSAATVPPLDQAVRQLKSEEVTARRKAAETLGRLHDPQAAPALMEALQDQDAYVRVLAIRGLGALHERQAVELLSERLAKDSSEQVRQAAASGLRMILDPAGEPALIKALSDPSEPVRLAVLSALVGFRSPAAVKAIGQAAGDASASVRRRAAIAYTEILVPGSPPPEALKALAVDPDPTVRQAAEGSLHYLAQPAKSPS